MRRESKISVGSIVFYFSEVMWKLTIGYITIPHTSRSYLKLPGYVCPSMADSEKVESFSDFWSHFWPNRTMAVTSEEAKYFTIKPSDLSEVFHRLTEYSKANLGH